MNQNKFNIIYSDVNINAGIEPEEIVINADSLNQNIMHILDTPFGSKWFRPDLGSDINKYLFEPIDDFTSEKIKVQIMDALEHNGEHRIIFTNIVVKADPSNAQYFVEISYTAPLLNDHGVTFNFNLTRGFS